ncbi:hypothetical protein ACFSC4_15575 [Deinococcus malanensis]|uniref:hypothetical protein n=1 Tax=Deinococcus malanensis TaxID=1706855 RepID=UPI0036305225
MQRLTEATVAAIAQAVRQPVKYAGGGGSHKLFGMPAPAQALSGHLLAGTRPAEPAFVVSAALWQTFNDLSLWVEALCLHEWSLYVERVTQHVPVSRGQVFTLLTATPAARIPLTWERHQVQLLMLEGAVFHCPWTHKLLTPATLTSTTSFPWPPIPSTTCGTWSLAIRSTTNTSSGRVYRTQLAYTGRSRPSSKPMGCMTSNR